MPHRTDAADRRIVACLLLILAPGCAAVGSVKPSPVAAPVSPPAPLPNVPPLAITTPPQADNAVRQAGGQAPQPPAPTADPVTPGETDPLRRLYRDAANSYSKLSCYIARLRRREVVQGRAKPEEVLIFKFREKPYSVHFKWLGEEGQGREVVYVRGGDEKLHILTAANDIPFTPAGRRLSLAADSIMVKAASKYPITEAGIGNMIARYGRMLDTIRAGGSGVSAKYLGPVQRPEYPVPLEGVECTFAADREPEIPNGGKRLVFFDPTTHFPVLSLTFDTAGREVDYYCFDRFQIDVKLDDDDFNPEKLWGKKAP
jgi:hypothetical protein